MNAIEVEGFELLAKPLWRVLVAANKARKLRRDELGAKGYGVRPGYGCSAPTLMGKDVLQSE